MKLSPLALKRQAILQIREQYTLPSDIQPTRWGINKTWTRTDFLKGILWTVFSRFVRMRDMGLLAKKYYEGDKRFIGVCISCGCRKDYAEMQAGHFAPVAGGSIEQCFDEKNVNAECAGCNADFHNWHLIPMRRNLIVKYGEPTVINIERVRSQKLAVKWTERDFVERIHFYYKAINK